MRETEKGSLERILDRIEAAGDDARVSVRDVVQRIGTRSFTPLFLVPALALVSPLSAIPVLPSVLAAMVALITAQILSGRQRLWLPDLILRPSVPRERVRRAIAVMRRPIRIIDPYIRERLTVLTDRPANTVPLILCCAISLIVPILEFVPMLTSVLASAIAFFAIGLFARDGLIVLIGYTIIGAVILVVDEVLSGLRGLI